MHLRQETSGHFRAKDVLLSTPDETKERNNDLNE